jgi:post-segregation antitoxin (ccd killing protein)
MKVVTSIRISQDVFNHLKQLDVNVSDYVNTLILDDLTKSSYDDTRLKNVVDIAIKEEKKSKIIQELKLIGALNNIAQRLNDMSKEDPEVYATLLKKNIELLQIEFDFDYSPDTKALIKDMYRKLNSIQKELAPYEKQRKLNNGKKKHKGKKESV